MVMNPSAEMVINMNKIKDNLNCLIQWGEYDALNDLMEQQTDIAGFSWKMKVLSNMLPLYRLQREMGGNTVLHHRDSLDACVLFYITYTYYLLGTAKQCDHPESETWKRLLNFVEENQISAFEIITTCAYIKMQQMQKYIDTLGCVLYEEGKRRMAIDLLDLYLQIYEPADEVALDLTAILLYEEDYEGARNYLNKVRVHNDAYLEMSRKLDVSKRE